MFDTILVNFKVLIVIIRAKFVLFRIDDVNTIVLNVKLFHRFNNNIKLIFNAIAFYKYDCLE